MENLMFMIEGPGPAMDLVKKHIDEVIKSRLSASRILKTFGLNSKNCTVYTDQGGLVLGVITSVKLGPDWKKPDRRGVQYPKINSETAKILAKQKGYQSPETLIARTLKVPLSLQYKTKNGSGSTIIGSPLNAAGFLYTSKDGPYAMWIPDVHAHIADLEKRTKGKVTDIARNFKPEFEGCRLIEPEEWDIIVAQHKLAEKKAEAAVKATARKGEPT